MDFSTLKTLSLYRNAADRSVAHLVWEESPGNIEHHTS